MTLSDTLRSLTASLTNSMVERKRIRGPANLRYAIADAIDLLDLASWNALTDGASFFLSRDYLAALEAVMPINMSARYALIYHGSGADREPVAAVYMQVADIKLAQTGPEKSAEQSAAPLHQLAQVAGQRVLICGNFLTYGLHGIAFAPGVDLKLAWHGVAEVLYRIRQAEKLAGKTHFVMIKDLHEPFTEAGKHLEHLSYRYVETEPNMVLTLDKSWKNHDDYLASLASKYRSSVRNAVFKPLEVAGCVVENMTGMAEVQERIFALYKMVQANAGFRPVELLPEYFAALEQVAGERFRCTVIRQGASLLGFLISVADGETSIAYHIGFDRTMAENLPLYLRLLHAGITDAIAMGCTQVSFGRTALEPKAALGAKPQPFGILIRHRQPILNKLIKGILLGIEHQEAPERSPFKKKAERV